MADVIARPDWAGMALASGLEMQSFREAALINSAYDAITDINFGPGLGNYTAVLGPRNGFTRPPAVISPTQTDANLAFPAVGAHSPSTHAWIIPYRGISLDMEVQQCGCGLCAEKAVALLGIIMHDKGGNNVGTTLLARPGGPPLLVPCTAWWPNPAADPNCVPRGCTYGAIRPSLVAAALTDVIAPRIITRWRGDYHNAVLRAAIMF